MFLRYQSYSQRCQCAVHRRFRHGRPRYNRPDSTEAKVMSAVLTSVPSHMNLCHIQEVLTFHHSPLYPQKQCVTYDTTPAVRIKKKTFRYVHEFDLSPCFALGCNPHRLHPLHFFIPGVRDGVGAAILAAKCRLLRASSLPPTDGFLVERDARL